MSNGIYVLVPTGYAIGDAFVADNYANSNFGNGAYKKIKYLKFRFILKRSYEI